MSEFLPIFLNVADNCCLVVGGGEIAARKVRQLLKAQASVQVVAPVLCPGLQELVDMRKIHHKASEFNEEDINECTLIIAATDDYTVNKQVSELARQRQIPVNVVDSPELCSFIMPSIVDRDPVQIAISTGGASPVLAIHKGHGPGR